MEREDWQGIDAIWAEKHAESMVYDWDVDVRCRVAGIKAARTLSRMAATIKECWEVIDEYKRIIHI